MRYYYTSSRSDEIENNSNKCYHGCEENGDPWGRCTMNGVWKKVWQPIPWGLNTALFYVLNSIPKHTGGVKT